MFSASGDRRLLAGDAAGAAPEERTRLTAAAVFLSPAAAAPCSLPPARTISAVCECRLPAVCSGAGVEPTAAAAGLTAGTLSDFFFVFLFFFFFSPNDATVDVAAVAAAGAVAAAACPPANFTSAELRV